jgi:molecular chaperone DnaK
MNNAWNAASQDLYQAMNQQQANSSTNNSNANSNDSASGSENVTDVDYEEVK